MTINLFREKAPDDMAAAIARIPVIDVADAFSGDIAALETTAAAIREACLDVGFFYIRGHGVPEATIERAFAESRRFHALPLEEKNKLPLDQGNIGYLAMNTSMQKHSTVHKATKPNQNESFFISHDRGPDHPDIVAGTEFRGANQWPEDLPGFREGVMAYFQALNAVGQGMLPLFARALEMPADYFDADFSNENHATLRMLHYPPTEVEDNDFGTGPHTDNSFMTILARTEVAGLAIRLPEGVWVPPPLVEGTFLVNIGNMLRRISNDRFLSTPHGVLVEGNADRYSIAYFHSPNAYSTIRVASSGITEATPACYPDALYADLIREFYSVNYFHQKTHDKAKIENQYA